MRSSGGGGSANPAASRSDPARRWRSASFPCFGGAWDPASDLDDRPAAAALTARRRSGRFAKNKKTAPDDLPAEGGAAVAAPARRSISDRLRNLKQKDISVDQNKHQNNEHDQTRSPRAQESIAGTIAHAALDHTDPLLRTPVDAGPPNAKTGPNSVGTVAPDSEMTSAKSSSPAPSSAAASAASASLDAKAGLSFLAVVLVLMIIFGRVCAIVCACLWVYLVSRNRMTDRRVDKIDGQSGTTKPAGGSDGGDDDRDMDLDSEEYKKKVVMQGLLERNNRRRSGKQTNKNN